MIKNLYYFHFKFVDYFMWKKGDPIFKNGKNFKSTKIKVVLKYKKNVL